MLKFLIPALIAFAIASAFMFAAAFTFEHYSSEISDFQEHPCREGEFCRYDISRFLFQDALGSLLIGAVAALMALTLLIINGKQQRASISKQN